MNTLKAESSHLQAFLVYAKQCADDGLSLYASTMDDHQAYLKKRLAYVGNKIYITKTIIQHRIIDTTSATVYLLNIYYTVDNLDITDNKRYILFKHKMLEGSVI